MNYADEPNEKFASRLRTASTGPQISPGYQDLFREAAQRLDHSIAWLIEMSDGGQPTYWCRLDDEDGVLGWCKDHDRAVRFCRKQDAQAIIDENMWTEPKPVEHMWISTAKS